MHTTEYYVYSANLRFGKPKTKRNSTLYMPVRQTGLYIVCLLNNTSITCTSSIASGPRTVGFAIGQNSS